MKKGFLASVAICSLLVMSACGNDTKETTETPAEQTASQPVEQKTETEAATPEVEAAAEPEVEEVVVEEETEAAEVATLADISDSDISEADMQKLDDYMLAYETAVGGLEPAMVQMMDAINAVRNGESDIDTLISELTLTTESFTQIRTQFEAVPVPEFELQVLNDKFSELHEHTLTAIIAGQDANALTVEAFQTEDEDTLNKALDAFNRMAEEGAAISAISEEFAAVGE